MTPNLRTLKVTTSSGKNVKDTDMLRGAAEETKAEKERNEMRQYDVGGAPKGDLGGENAGK
jgi:hypothetical protein